MNITEIENTIQQLEEGETSFAACDKLASLYIVRDHLVNIKTEDKVEIEYSDILPSYRNYCEMKRRYQMKQGTKEDILTSANIVGNEIKEFLLILYNNTDSEEERNIFKTMVNSLFV